MPHLQIHRRRISQPRSVAVTMAAIIIRYTLYPQQLVGRVKSHLKAGSSGESTHSAPLLHLVAQELGHHDPLLKAHHGGCTQLVLQQSAVSTPPLRIYFRFFWLYTLCALLAALCEAMRTNKHYCCCTRHRLRATGNQVHCTTCENQCTTLLKPTGTSLQCKCVDMLQER